MSKTILIVLSYVIVSAAHAESVPSGDEKAVFFRMQRDRMSLINSANQQIQKINQELESMRHELEKKYRVNLDDNLEEVKPRSEQADDSKTTSK